MSSVFCLSFSSLLNRACLLTPSYSLLFNDGTRKDLTIKVIVAPSHLFASSHVYSFRRQHRFNTW
jgi:hypothetical protein